MKGSVTRLIDKKRGDIKNLKNWRPISLVNVDYKIISKVLTSRLAKILESTVNPDQTCSVPERSIFSNVTLMNALFLLAETKKKPLIELIAVPFSCNYT